MDKHNFYAGPSVVAKEVIAEAAEGLLDYNGSGLSIAEVSHRSDMFAAILDEAIELVKEIANLDDDFAVLYLQGGGRQQFFQVPFNLSTAFSKTYYIDTGSWAHLASHEATFFGKAVEIASSKASNYRHIPKNFKIPGEGSYLHITSNNTIYGTQYHQFPKCQMPVVVDKSSDIFCREMDYNQFGLVYAAAQKNAGIAGTTIVMVRKSLLKKDRGSIPTMIDYNTHIEKNSLYNTAPVFAIYMSMLVLRWIKAKGGLQYFDLHNRKKADLLYKEIDRNGLFKGHAVEKDRSIMNAVFDLRKNSDIVRKGFLHMCKNAGIVGIEGHKSVGGYRASMYNALKLESVEVLVDVMKELERTAG